MSNNIQLSTGLYKASTYTHFYDLNISVGTNLLVTVYNDSGVSSIYDSSYRYLSKTTSWSPLFLEVGSYIVQAKYSSPTNGVLSVYLPSASSFENLQQLSTGSFRAVTYSNIYALQIGQEGDIFLDPNGDSANATIYDVDLNFVAYGGILPVHLKQGNYVVVATYSGYKNGVLNVNIPEALIFDGTSINSSGVLRGDDRFLGSVKPDLVQGLDGDDVFTGYSDYSRGDAFFGGNGIDVAVYQGPRDDYRIDASVEFQDYRKPDGFLIHGVRIVDQLGGRDGTDYLHEVERLQFADTNLAFDLTSSGNAAKTAQFLGLLGYSFLSQKAVVGTVLGVFDQTGINLSEAFSLVLNNGLVNELAGGASDTAFVKLVHRNLLGTEASDAVAVTLATQLLKDSGGAFSRIDLLNLGAGLDENLQHVGLVGITGPARHGT